MAHALPPYTAGEHGPLLLVSQPACLRWMCPLGVGGGSIMHSFMMLIKCSSSSKILHSSINPQSRKGRLPVTQLFCGFQISATLLSLTATWLRKRTLRDHLGKVSESIFLCCCIGWAIMSAGCVIPPPWVYQLTCIPAPCCSLRSGSKSMEIHFKLEYVVISYSWKTKGSKGYKRNWNHTASFRSKFWI